MVLWVHIKKAAVPSTNAAGCRCSIVHLDSSSDLYFASVFCFQEYLRFFSSHHSSHSPKSSLPLLSAPQGQAGETAVDLSSKGLPGCNRRAPQRCCRQPVMPPRLPKPGRLESLTTGPTCAPPRPLSPMSSRSKAALTSASSSSASFSRHSCRNSSRLM